MRKAILAFLDSFFPTRNKSLPKSLQIHFSNFAVLFVRGDARVTRDIKNTKWQMDQIREKNFRNEFLNLTKWR